MAVCFTTASCSTRAIQPSLSLRQLLHLLFKTQILEAAGSGAFYVSEEQIVFAWKQQKKSCLVNMSSKSHCGRTDKANRGTFDRKSTEEDKSLRRHSLTALGSAGLSCLVFSEEFSFPEAASSALGSGLGSLLVCGASQSKLQHNMISLGLLSTQLDKKRHRHLHCVFRT